MKRVILISGILMTIMFTGCGKSIYPELPENAIAFEMGEMTDITDNDSLYATFEYNGRTYMGYGTLNGSMKEKNINSCIGYLVQDGDTTTDIRVYTLTDNMDNDYLMTYVDGVMNQPFFWRAVDTCGTTIDTPKYIESLGYSSWE